jgi:ABC-type oligopeptide transport system substrate-binding subunit
LCSTDRDSGWTPYFKRKDLCQNWGFGAATLLVVAGLEAFFWLRPAEPSTPRGAVLNRGNVAEPDTLDPPQYGLAVEVEILNDLFLGLTARDQSGNLIPGAAERWGISPDGTTYTFHLRKGLLWSDGSPLTAMDFVAGIRRMLDPATHASSPTSPTRFTTARRSTKAGCHQARPAFSHRMTERSSSGWTGRARS